MIYLKFKKYLLLFFIILFSCSESEGEDSIPVLRSNVLIDKGIYKVSYNEIFEQPNWIEYTVSNRPKNVDRGNKDFYLESGFLYAISINNRFFPQITVLKIT